MKVNLHGAFTYKAYFVIKEEAYTKLLSSVVSRKNIWQSPHLRYAGSLYRE